MQRNTFLIILMVALLVIFGIAYGLKPRPMSKDDALGRHDQSAVTTSPIYSEETRRMQYPGAVGLRSAP